MGIINGDLEAIKTAGFRWLDHRGKFEKKVIIDGAVGGCEEGGPSL